MSKRKKLKYAHIPKLEPIIYDKNLSAFDLSNYIDIVSLKLVLDDYDWANYNLSVGMLTKEYGEMKIEFEYYGFIFCTMKVETEDRIYSYRFNTELFQEHIIRFIQTHIKSWRETPAIKDAEEVVNFYNDVLMDLNTVEESNKPLVRRRRT